MSRVAVALLSLALFGCASSRDREFARYREAAFAHFQKRCKENAGEKIHRTVENVAGIYIPKPRKTATEAELRDQYWRGDPYGHSTYEASNPAGAYLFGRSGNTISGRKLTPLKGYQYVEMPNSSTQAPDAPRYLRYTLEQMEVPNTVTKQLEKRILPKPMETNELSSQYAIEWEDISTEEDRKYWVAGGRLTVFDRETREILGERVGYVIDPDFGDVSGGRTPWIIVNFIPGTFCPVFESRFDRNMEFVAKVLKAY